jgi:hypothetical protein
METEERAILFILVGVAGAGGRSVAGLATRWLGSLVGGPWYSA